MIEAFVDGTPLNASHIGAMPEFVEQGKIGFLRDSANTAALAKPAMVAFQQLEDPIQMRIAVPGCC